jgi:hypothetical protein
VGARHDPVGTPRSGECFTRELDVSGTSRSVMCSSSHLRRVPARHDSGERASGWRTTSADLCRDALLASQAVEPEDYVIALRREGARLAAAATDLTRPVPSCPEWTVADLV